MGVKWSAFSQLEKILEIERLRHENDLEIERLLREKDFEKYQKEKAISDQKMEKEHRRRDKNDHNIKLQKVQNEKVCFKSVFTKLIGSPTTHLFTTVLKIALKFYSVFTVQLRKVRGFCLRIWVF